jgi:tetratricopeptide (TPR) repeat protein
VQAFWGENGHTCARRPWLYKQKPARINSLDFFQQALNNKAVALGNLQKHEEVGRVCDDTLRINPDDDIAWTCKGASLGFLGKYDEAIECCQKALTLNPNNNMAKMNLTSWTELKAQSKQG